MPREHGLKDHDRHGKENWGTEAPCTVYEKKPLTDPKGNVVPGLYTAWIRLNNPAQYNSYTTEMVKGVIAGFENSSTDREVVAVVFTGHRPERLLHGRQHEGVFGILQHASGRVRLIHGALQQHGRLHPHVQEARHLPGQRHEGRRRPGDRHCLRPHDHLRPRDFRPGGSAARLRPCRRRLRLPPFLPQHRRRHVELRELRNVDRLQDVVERACSPRCFRS